MKKHWKRYIYILAFLLLVLFFIYFFPKKLNKDYNGIRYRLGSSEQVEDVELNIDGYLSKGLFKGDRFKGTITIGDKKLSKLDMRFDRRGSTVLFYYDDKTGDYTAYGTIFTNDMKKEFTITVLEKDDQEGQKLWSGKDGLMISVPANNREKALALSNKLMEDVLIDFELK